MSKPKETSWLSYIKWGVIKKIRRKILGNICKLILQMKPVWGDIVFYKKEVKKYSQFDKKYEDYCKYLIIYRTVRKFKPKYILECGSGISTLIILRALKENGLGKLISMDEYEEYGNIVEKIASDSLLEMHISASEEGDYKEIQGTKYKVIPEYPYDLIFVDGPVTKAVDLDAFYLLEKNPEARVLIDCRVKTINALKTRWKGKYNPFTNMGYINF